MSYRLIVVVSYVGATILWISAADNAVDPKWDAWLFASWILLHLSLGSAMGRWWAALLPVLAVPLAVPSGYEDSGYGEAPLWFYVTVGLLIAVPLVVFGVFVRQVSDYLRRTRPRSTD